MNTKLEFFCEDCAFFSFAGYRTEEFGQCRRHAPRAGRGPLEPDPYLATDGQALWPTVRLVDWCGEFVHEDDWPREQT